MNTSDAPVRISLLAVPVAPGILGTECLLCERLVKIGEPTDCPHYRGIDSGFAGQTRLEFSY